MNPKLSIITINLNNSNGLQKSIESVVSQNFEDYEYLIVDGGSIDDSKNVILKFANKISFWISEPDKGIYNAMNKGILRAKGEYLLFLNSGDCLENENVLHDVFSEDRTADIIYGHLNLSGEDGIKVHRAIDEKKLSLTYFFNDSLGHSSTFISKKLFVNDLYDESFSIAADKKFFIEKIIQRNCSIQKVDLIIANFNLNGISNNPRNQNKIREENNRIFNNILPPRIAKDYELNLLVKNSILLKYLPYLNRTNRLQKIVGLFACFLIKIHNLFNKNITFPSTSYHQ